VPRGERVVIAITLYSRPGCHLCDDMKAVVQRVARTLPTTPVTVVEIDISTDSALDERYGTEIPVLLVEGKKVAKYRIGEDELRRVLLARGHDREAEGAGKAG
jgi:thiol-disulfide isomerase/thioredoxin